MSFWTHCQEYTLLYPSSWPSVLHLNSRRIKKQSHNVADLNIFFCQGLHSPSAFEWPCILKTEWVCHSCRLYIPFVLFCRQHLPCSFLLLHLDWFPQLPKLRSKGAGQRQVETKMANISEYYVLYQDKMNQNPTSISGLPRIHRREKGLSSISWGRPQLQTFFNQSYFNQMQWHQRWEGQLKLLC